MRIRIFIVLFLAGILSVGLNSCKDYLDTKPYSFNTVDNLYTSAQGAELGLTGCYNILNAETVQEGAWAGSFVATVPYMLNGGTDEVVLRDGIIDPNWAPFGNGTYTSQNPKLKDTWFVFFAGINRVNYFLEKIDGIDMDRNRKIEMIGEAHFLRGFYYFYLAVEFGALPVFTSSDHNINAQRESLENVYKLILADLTIAYQNLPDRAGKSGRANKWSAAGYLTKVYTYLASCKINNVGESLNFDLNSFAWVNENEMYKNAINVSEDIIENSGLKLTQNYDYLFRETTDQWKAEESLFSILGSKNVSNGNFNLLLFWQIPVGVPDAGGGYGQLRPTGEHFFKYDSTDLRRFQNLTEALFLDNPTEIIEGVIYYVPIPLTDPMETDFCVGKYRYREASAKNISSAWSDGDIILLRYADILLLNAEALYFTGDETGARSRLREVRERIATDTNNLDNLTVAYYRPDFIEELLDSRSRELCFEGWRRIDLIRFAKMDETIAGLSSDLGYWNTIVPVLQANWKHYKIWFPIPRSDIELSPLVQNPGYN